jgi:hypothetical protein
MSTNQILAKNAKPGKAPALTEVRVPVTSPGRVRKWAARAAEASARATRRLAKATSSPFWWAAVSCAILGISAGSYVWRDWKYESFAQVNAKCPFPLKDLPKEVGTWQAEGEDGQLAPQIARLAGSNSHVVRLYRDTSSGAVVSVLVLYGVANSVFAHRPEVCFTGAGFQEKGDPTDSVLRLPGEREPVRYRVAYFAKTVGGIQQEVEVCHTFLHHNAWLPYLDNRWKLFRQYPAMCKIQIERVGERTALETSPSVSLLQGLVEAINARMANAEKAARQPKQNSAEQRTSA